MHAHLIWLEGVDFDAHLEDTTNLSVIRGSSLGMLAAADFALALLQPHGYSLVFGGASLALLRADVTAQAAEQHRDDLLAALHKANGSPDPTGDSPPFAHLRFVAGVAADDGTPKGPRLAQARARRMQLSGGLLRPAPIVGKQECRFSGHRVGNHLLNLRKDHAASYNHQSPAQDEATLWEEAWISTSALARWHYGRRQRQLFYQGAGRGTIGQAVPPDHGFTENLQHMVQLKAQSPANPGADILLETLPLSLLGKIAVFYADGNGFGAIRDAFGGTPDALGSFARQADAVVQNGFAAALRCLTGPILAGQPDPVLRAAAVFHDRFEKRRDYHQDQLRFETLFYGGDEISFVAPAWFGLAMAAAFFEAVRGAKAKAPDGTEHALTFKAGLALVPVKMPIRASYELAKDLAGKARRAGNGIAIHAFESMEPPPNGLAALREALFGSEEVTPLLALDGDEFAENLARLGRAQRSGALPRSQLFKLLRAAQWPSRSGAGFITPRRLGNPEANKAAAKEYDTYSKKSDAADSTEAGGWLGWLKDNDKAAIAAWLLTHLWDYVDPLSDHAGGGA